MPVLIADGRHFHLMTDSELREGKAVHDSAAKITGEVLKAVVAGLGRVPIGGERTKRYSLTCSESPRVELFGSTIRYSFSVTGHGVEFARAEGGPVARIADEHGTYFCLADEIHYRAKSRELILKGDFLISTGPVIDEHKNSLIRIDLARCVAERSSARD